MGTTVFRIRIELILRRCWNLITPLRPCRGSPPNVGRAVYLGHGLVGGSRRQPASISFSSAEARARAGQKRPAIRDGPKFRELPCRTAIATYDVSSGRGVFATHTQPPRELGSQLLLCLQPDFGWTAQFGAQYTTCEGS